MKSTPGCAATARPPRSDARRRASVGRALAALGLCCGLSAPAWATSLLHEDFEDDALGTLSADWTISSAGSGNISIATTPDHGHTLRLQGSTTEGHFLIASRSISSSSTEITTEIDIRPNIGASFIWTLNGAGSSIGRRRIRLQQSPGSTSLVANTVPSGDTTCGTLAAGAWSTVTLTVDTAAQSFDVLINGEATACTGISTGLQPPFNSISVMDASNAGWGGLVRFDNIDVTTP